jgi:very-short-patch-repair endonuclease
MFFMDRARFASRHMFKRARQLRKDATPEEAILWAQLRGTSLGAPICRQHPLGNVVVDFYCPRAKVAIELDGAHHDASADAERDQMLSTRGIAVVRFENFHIRQNLSSVVAAIRELVLSRAALLREPETSNDDIDD